jgi:type II secretory pathway pseudopilin PulG
MNWQQAKMSTKGFRLMAFTIIELMVALVLFVTIISMAMLLWSNVQKGLSLFQKSSEEYYQFITLTARIERDFSQTQYTSFQVNSITFSTDSDETTYTILPYSVVCSNSKADIRYPVKLVRVTPFYYGDTDLVTELALEFEIQGKRITYHITRKVTGKQHFNSTLDYGS